MVKPAAVPNSARFRGTVANGDWPNSEGPVLWDFRGRTQGFNKVWAQVKGLVGPEFPGGSQPGWKPISQARGRCGKNLKPEGLKGGPERRRPVHPGVVRRPKVRVLGPIWAPGDFQGERVGHSGGN